MNKVSSKHNKRRSVGIVYEMLVRTVSVALIEDNSQRSSVALNIIKKHFQPGTELYKEFRLINSLMKVQVSSPGVAGSIMSEAKIAARSHDVSKLDREKSLLLRDINHKLSGSVFWEATVPQYKMLATIQTLINDWRRPNEVPLDRLAAYEQKLSSWLLESKDVTPLVPVSELSRGDSRLLFQVMSRKLNEKYGVSLTLEQKALLQEYVFVTDDSGLSEKFLATLRSTRDQLTTRIEAYLDNPTTNEYVKNPMRETLAVLTTEKLDEVNDAVFTRFMLYSKLIAELDSKEETPL